MTFSARQKAIASKAKNSGLDAALFILDPTYNAAAIPKRKTRKRVRLFEDGELGRLIIVALRKATSPPTTHEIAATIASQRDIAHTVLITRRIRSNLAYLEGQGRVTKIGDGFNATWIISRQSAEKRVHA